MKKLLRIKNFHVGWRLDGCSCGLWCDGRLLPCHRSTQAPISISRLVRDHSHVQPTLARDLSFAHAQHDRWPAVWTLQRRLMNVNGGVGGTMGARALEGEAIP